MNPDNRASQTVEVLAYQPAYKSYFKTLNEAWIGKYFRLEKEDQRILNDPEGEILEKGGFVFFARLNGEMVGTCGLTRNADGSFELVKMGVDEKAQGMKIGYRLAEAAIAKAREEGADQVVLYSSTLLKPAIGLYRKLGFREVRLADCHFERCDIKMALSLSEGKIHYPMPASITNANTMNENLQNDLLKLDSLLEKVKDQGLQYLNNISDRPTSTKKIINGKLSLSEIGSGTIETLKQFNERFEPIIVSASGPRFWGFVTGGSTPASIAGDWLTAIYDQNAFATKGQGDISAIIELETIQLLLDLFELPHDFLGGFVTGATMSNFTCLAVARQWLGKASGKDFAKEGVSGNVNILTATPHSSAIKSLSLLGIGSNNIMKVKTLDGNREAMNVADLKNKINQLGGEPFILISSGGTVNTVDFDDFLAINDLKEKYNFWWHIDAAFGGFAVCSKTHKHLVKGWENADSITIDCHKWLNVPYESAAFFVKEKHNILQTETFQNSNAPYLGNPLENFSYLNLLPENSRRLKALPVWFSLNAYGKKGYQDIVENCIFLSNQFGQFIEENENFELLAPVRLNTVCFTLAGKENQAKVNTFLTLLNDTGQVFMTPTIYNGQKGIRAAFVNWRTTENDIALVTKLMTEIINELK